MEQSRHEQAGLADQLAGSSLSESSDLVLETALVKTLEINGEQFDIGSDWHLPLDENYTNIIRSNLRSNKGSEILLCLGDTYDTAEGQDSSASVNEFLDMASREYSLVVFLPGNHDLRGRNNPFSTLARTNEILIPDGSNPITLNTERNKIVLGNIFYDLEFIDPQIVDLSEDDLREFYPGLPDGQHLFGGSLERFPEMTEALANFITEDIDMIITHALPHPSLVTFRVPEKTTEIKSLEAENGLTFICDPAEDQEQAKRWDTTPEDFRAWWNKKSLFMGSDVLNHSAANPKDGITAVYGHNHRSKDTQARLRNGQEARLLSYQTPLR